MSTFSAKSNRHYYLACLVCVIVASGVLYAILKAEEQPYQDFAWEKILKAFDEYFGQPSPENAKKILAILPGNRTELLSLDAGEALEYIISAENYGILALESMAGDRYSIEILFRLRNISDGGASETLEGTLGNVLRINPTLFLDVLLDYQDIWFIKRSGVPVTFPGYAYNVHNNARRYDLEKRMDALDTVSNPKYDEIKKICKRKIEEELSLLRTGKKYEKSDLP